VASPALAGRLSLRFRAYPRMAGAAGGRRLARWRRALAPETVTAPIVPPCGLCVPPAAMEGARLSCRDGRPARTRPGELYGGTDVPRFPETRRPADAPRPPHPWRCRARAGDRQGWGLRGVMLVWEIGRGRPTGMQANG
jgi:hypothetical protein